MKKNSNYIDKKEFADLVKEYQRTKDKKLYEKIGKNILEIVTRYMFNVNIVNYDQGVRSQMISDALFYCSRKIDTFDFEKSDNPFGYFTEITKRAVWDNINKMHKRMGRYINVDFIENVNNSYDMDEDAEFVNGNKTDNFNRYDVSLDYVENEIKKLNTYIDKGE